MIRSHAFTKHLGITFVIFALGCSGVAFAADEETPPKISLGATGNVATATAEQMNKLRQDLEEKSAIENPDYTVADDGSKYATVKTNWRSADECSIRREQGSTNVAPCLPWEISNANPDEPSETEPTSIEVLAKAMDSVTIQGAGLVVQPTEWVYLGVPTLAHAQTDTIHTSVTVLGLEVPVTMTATSFSFDFNNGVSPVESLVPGEPWPSMEIYGIYEEESDNQTVTLRTTWKAVATHPITGESIEVDGLLTTVEESAPFKVKKRRIRLMDSDDFGKL